MRNAIEWNPLSVDEPHKLISIKISRRLKPGMLHDYSNLNQSPTFP